MSKLLIIALTALALGALYLNHHHSVPNMNRLRFEQWKLKNAKHFTSLEEEAYRFKIYSQKVEMIDEHNADPTQTYKMGENQFTILTEEEFASIYLTYKSIQKPLGTQEYIPTTNGSNAVDWGTLTKVKNQGQCGSCWAFSAVGAIESLFRVKRGNNDDFSEQQLVDCDANSDGCDGGYPDLAIGWAAKNGLVKGSEYPYVAKDQTCKTRKGSNKPSGYKIVSASNLKAAITDYPVSVCVDATNWSAYASGVFSKCAKSLNHAVLATGFKDSGEWIIKNSWGTGWGEEGFIRLAAGNTCGVTDEAAIAY